MNNTEITYTLTGVTKPFKDKELPLNISQIEEFYFIESLEQIFLSGCMTINDVGGFFEKLPLTGNEGIRVNLTQDLEHTKDSSQSIFIEKVIEFDIYNVSIPDHRGINQSLYKFVLIEKGGLNFLQNSYSKSYAQKKISEIIKDICDNQLKIKEYNIETTEDKIDYIIPYWQPSITIKDLLSKSRRTKSPYDGGFLFYSSTENEVPTKRFVSFSTLLETKASTNEKDKLYFKNHTINQNHINIIKEAENIDYINRAVLSEGLTGKKYLGVDFLVDKKPIILSKTYSEFVKSSNMMDSFSYFNSDIDDKNGDIQVFGTSEKIIEAELNHSFRMVLESINKKIILLNGCLDRYAGKTVYIEVTSDNHNETFHISDTGVWIIKGITHYFKGNYYQNKMVVIKDSVAKSESDIAMKL